MAPSIKTAKEVRNNKRKCNVIRAKRFLVSAYRVAATLAAAPIFSGFC